MIDEFGGMDEGPDASRLGMLGGKLQRLFDAQVSKRGDLEKRWLEDLRQYNGLYDPDIASALQSSKRSQAFINVTRPKANKFEARIGDMLFPTDERNWGICPTPVPELIDQHTDRNPMTMNDGTPITVNGQPVTPADAADDIMTQAKKKAEAMQREIDDQLRECNYNGVGRDVIHSAALLGTGVLKGPVIIGRTKKSWRKITDEVGAEAQVLEIVDEHRPVAECVDVWNFYPDMNARTIEDAEFVFERHYMTRRQLRSLKKRPGFMGDQVDMLLKTVEEPRTTSSFMSELRSLTGAAPDDFSGRFEIIEYHGPITMSDLEACGCQMEEGTDLTDEVEAVVWFADGVVLKAVLNPLDTDERPYSVFCCEQDDTSIFGVGIPRLCRHQQQVINSAWRMAMDNAGLSTGPQIVINEKIIRPADGDWSLTPRKLWILNDPQAPINAAFASFEINSHTQELLAIINQAKAMVDDESGVKPADQSDQGVAPRTNLGIAMMMNVHNIDTRRSVKNWDDRITKPFIGRMYDWNMQYNDNEEIKGDYRIDARGSSALLVREMQQQALMQLSQVAMAPPFAPMTKWGDMYRKIVSSMQVDPDALIKTDDEIQLEQQKAAEQPPQMPPEIQMQMQKMQMAQQEAQARLALEAKKLDAEIMKIQNNAQNDAMDSEVARLQIQRDFAQFQFEMEKQARVEQLEMAKMANERQSTIEALQAQLGMKKLDLDSKHQLFNAEAALKVRQGSGI